MSTPKPVLPVVHLDRRGLLALACAGCGLAACGGGGGGTDAGPDGAPGDDGAAVDPCAGQDAGALADFPAGTSRRVDALVVIVARDAQGLWAVDATCPHFGGRIEPQSDGTLQCTNADGGADRHGARYDSEGANVRAEAGLGAKAVYDRPNYAVSLCEGRVLVDRGRIVPRGTRAPAP